MTRSAHVWRTLCLLTFIAAAPRSAKAITIITFGTFDASLDTGVLAGVSFPVSYSYDAGQIAGTGDSFIGLNSFNFTLLGTPFTLNDIDQGGQIVFRNGILENITASFQGV